MISANSSFTVFIVENLGKAKDFYSQYFSFSAAFENEWYLHLVSATGIQIGFMLPHQPTQPEAFQDGFSGQGIILSLEVDDVDQAYTEARENGLNIILSLRSEDWGQRHFSVQDPNGVYLDVVQAIAPTEEYQSGYAEE